MSLAPVIVVVPALGVAPRHYEALLKALTDELGGDAELLTWQRPHTLRERLLPARAEGYVDLVRNIRSRVEALRQRFIGRPVFLLGHSLGGQAGLLAAAQEPSLLDGIVLLACGTPHWGAWPLAQQRGMRRGIRVVDWVSRVLPWYPGNWVGFGGAQPRRLMRDWVSTARTGRYDGTAGGTGSDTLLQLAAIDVLALRIEGDAYAPECAVEFLLAKLARARVTRAVASSEILAAQSPVRRHSAWLREPMLVVPSIRAWIAGPTLAQTRADSPRRRA